MKSLWIAAIGVAALGLTTWIYRADHSVPTSLPAQRLEPPAPSDTTEPEPTHVVAARVPSPAVSAPVPATAPGADAPVTEAAFAATMHGLERADPARALALARQGLTKWPQSERAAEFAATEVKCLYLLGRPSEGRGAAEAMVNKYTNSQWALEVERETGAHPYVNH